MYRSEFSDRYFELQERANELAKNSRTIAAAKSGCSFCNGCGSVPAVEHKNVEGEYVKLRLDPPKLLPCVCTVGWPYFGQGGEGAD